MVVTTSRSARLALFLLAAGCAGPITAQDVRRMDRAKDVDGLLDAWHRGPPTSVAPKIVDALARYADDDRAADVVLEAARRHPNEPTRRQAVERLTILSRPAADAVAIDALGDPFPSVRAQAKATLTSRGDRVFEALRVAGRSHRSPLVRSAAIELITRVGLNSGELRAAAKSTLLDRARRDDGPVVRAAAADGLGALNVIEARPTLTAMMRTDDDPKVRLQAGRALSKLDAPTEAERTVIAVLPLKNETGEKGLGRFGDQVADLLAAELATSGVCEVVDSAKRDEAIRELTKSGSMLYDGDRPNGPEIGYFALADQLAFGVIQKTGLIYTLVLNRMDVSTLKLIGGASVTVRGYRADLDRMKVEAARKFVARFR